MQVPCPLLGGQSNPSAIMLITSIFRSEATIVFLCMLVVLMNEAVPAKGTDYASNLG